MSNLFDYLKWRGDLSFQQTPFNDIDSLILSRLSYLPFDAIVPDSFITSLTIAEAGNRFFQSENAAEKIIMRADLPLLSDVAASDRFANCGLCGYVNHVDLDDEKQFAALVIKISPGLSYISYRGTDLSLAGWKEDFNMSFATSVPAQEEAVRYLNQVRQHIPGKLILGGHSKGGNLAVYAGAFCEPETQNRIIAVYNNDGPGFDVSVLESAGYQRIAPRIKTFIPQSSVVGMLLQHEEDYYVVHSTQSGLMQHDLFSWEVNRDQFVLLDRVTDQSKFIDQTLKAWLATSSIEQREQFVDTLFSILEETGASTLKELTSNWHKNARIVLRSLLDMDDEMRQHLSQALNLLLQAARQNIQFSVPKPRVMGISQRFKHKKDAKTP